MEARKELALLLGWIPVSLLGVSLLSALAIHLILPLLSRGSHARPPTAPVSVCTTCAGDVPPARLYLP